MNKKSRLVTDQQSLEGATWGNKKEIHFQSFAKLTNRSPIILTYMCSRCCGELCFQFEAERVETAVKQSTVKKGLKGVPLGDGYI